MKSMPMIVLVVLMANGLTLSEEQGPQTAIAVRIVSPDRTRGDGPQLITLNQPSQHFHVVVTNVSGKPIRLWREWCSWGYYMLSFRVTDENGKVTEVKKGPCEWKKNYPDWTTLQPGDHMVYEVSFDERTWPDVALEQGKARQVRMSAVIEVKPDMDSEREDVWTGTVASPERSYTIAK